MDFGYEVPLFRNMTENVRIRQCFDNGGLGKK